MTATTINNRASFDLFRPLVRLALAAIVTVALLVAAFVVGRATAPTHTVKSIVAVPIHSVLTVADACHIGRPCWAGERLVTEGS